MPTVTIGDNTTVNPNTFSGCEDCEINAFFATTNLNAAANTLTVSGTFPSHALIKFSGLSNITGPVTVSSATLNLRKIQENPSFFNPSADFHRVLRNWVDTQATWNVYSTGNSWTTAGCQSDSNDRVATPTTDAALGEALNTYHAISMSTADVEGWINGTFSNYGWLIELTSGSVDNYWKFDSDSATDGQRPYLEVVYSTSGGGVPKTTKLAMLGVG